MWLDYIQSHWSVPQSCSPLSLCPKMMFWRFRVHRSPLCALIRPVRSFLTDRSVSMRRRFPSILSDRFFHQVHDPQSLIVWFSPSPRPENSEDRFWNFSYRQEIFLPCHLVRAKTAPRHGRRYYRGMDCGAVLSGWRPSSPFDPSLNAA